MDVEQGPFVPDAVWPVVVERPRSAVFVPRLPLRKLVVMVDADQVASVEGSGWSKEWLLAGLLTLDVVEVVRYADDGPPGDVKREHDLMGAYTPGWVEVGPEDHPYGIRPVRDANGRSTVRVEVGDFAANDVASDTYSDLGPGAAAERRAADALAGQVAEAVGADLFITTRHYRGTRRLTKGVTYCSIDEALALVGLYLRS
jgi:hypothetical protein